VLLILLIIFALIAAGGRGSSTAAFALISSGCKRQLADMVAEPRHVLVRRSMSAVADALTDNGVEFSVRNGIPYPTYANFEAAGIVSPEERAAFLERFATFIFRRMTGPDCAAAMTDNGGQLRTWETEWPGDAKQYALEIEAGAQAMLEALGVGRAPAAMLREWAS
jgi:hypothetical protein